METASMQLLVSFLFLVFSSNSLASDPCLGYNCLQEYVFREDGAYSWNDTGHRIRVDSTGGRGGWTGYFLNFTSQHWLTSDLVSRSEWWHILVVVVPDNISTVDTTLLWIGSGGNSDPLPDLADYDLLVAGGIATTNNLVTAALFQVVRFTGKILYSKGSQKDKKLRMAFLTLSFHPRYPTQALSLPMILSNHLDGRTLPLLLHGLQLCSIVWVLGFNQKQFQLVSQNCSQ